MLLRTNVINVINVMKNVINVIRAINRTKTGNENISGSVHILRNHRGGERESLKC